MAAAQGIIPFATNDPSGFQIPKGLDAAQTPQGGSAFKDTAGTYGQAGALYIKGANGFQLAPNNLPAPLGSQAPAAGQGNANLVNPADNGSTKVQPDGTTIKTAPTAPVPGSDVAGPNAQAIAAHLNSVSTTMPPEEPVPSRNGGTPTDNTEGDTSGTPAGDNAQPSPTPQPSTLDGLLAKLGPAPTAPDTVSQEAMLNANPGGVNDLQSNLNTLNDQMTQLQNDLQQRQAGEASKPGVVATIINGRMQMLSAQDSKALNDLKAQITSTTQQLTQAQTAVKSVMAATATDYKTAEAAYQFAYSKAITQYQDEQSQADKVQTAAKANAQVIINSYKGSADRANAITPDMEAQWATLEMQAGLPTGTIKAAVSAELNIEKFYKGSDGNMYAVQVVNGVPQTIKIGYAGGTTKEANGDSGTNDSGLTPAQQKRVDAFNKDLANSSQLTRKANPITREQYIRQLQAKYPDINSDQISQAVYKTYPDNSI